MFNFEDFSSFNFSFNPCNPRSSLIISRKPEEIIVVFDQRPQGEHQMVPECAAISIIKKSQPFPKSLTLKISLLDGNLEAIMVELKSGTEKEKYFETFVELYSQPDAHVLSLDNIKPDTTELVICSWRADNYEKYGSLMICT